jgi:malate synthase
VEKGSSKRADRALAAFAAAISSPEIRRLFENNEVSLDKMIKDKDGEADAGDLPESVRSFLNNLTSEEMRLLSRFGETLVNAGFVASPTEAAFTIAKF